MHSILFFFSLSIFPFSLSFSFQLIFPNRIQKVLQIFGEEEKKNSSCLSSRVCLNSQLQKLCLNSQLQRFSVYSKLQRVSSIIINVSLLALRQYIISPVVSCFPTSVHHNSTLFLLSLRRCIISPVVSSIFPSVHHISRLSLRSLGSVCFLAPQVCLYLRSPDNHQTE